MMHRGMCGDMCGVCARYVRGMYGVPGAFHAVILLPTYEADGDAGRGQRDCERGEGCVCSGYVRMCVGTCGYVRVCAGVCGCANVCGVSAGTCGYVRGLCRYVRALCGAGAGARLCGYVWVCVNICGAGIIAYTNGICFSTFELFRFPMQN